METPQLDKYQEYQQELFHAVANISGPPLESELHEIERVVLDYHLAKLKPTEKSLAELLEYILLQFPAAQGHIPLVQKLKAIEEAMRKVTEERDDAWRKCGYLRCHEKSNTECIAALQEIADLPDVESVKKAKEMACEALDNDTCRKALLKHNAVLLRPIYEAMMLVDKWPGDMLEDSAIARRFRDQLNRIADQINEATSGTAAAGKESLHQIGTPPSRPES